MKGIKIRTAQIEDAQAIIFLIVKLTYKYILPHCDQSAHALLLNSMSPEKVKSYIQKDYYIVAMSEYNIIVAVACIHDYKHLYHLFVDELYQGQGLSRYLWETIKDASLKQRHQGLFTVNASLNAEPIYLKFGFKRNGGVQNIKGVVSIPMFFQILNSR